MSWNLEGKRISGKYLGCFPYTGFVSESRVAYGGKIKHFVELDEELTAFGTVRDTIIAETNSHGEYIDFVLC